jgi:hypothetical protein
MCSFDGLNYQAAKFMLVFASQHFSYSRQQGKSYRYSIVTSTICYLFLKCLSHLLAFSVFVAMQLLVCSKNSNRERQNH